MAAPAPASAPVRTERLFVAGDALERSMFYPPEFAAVRGMVTDLAAAARRFDGTMREVIAEEGWPPPKSALRTRVVVDGTLSCCQCDGSFSRQWVARGVCWRCEARVRATGVCPFDLRQKPASAAPIAGGKGNSRGSGRPALHYGVTFCPHQDKCVVCDGGGFAPCRQCRLACGDGETVASVCAEWRGSEPTVLFYDFDRSLCSTKSGGSPLNGSHSVDADLADLASQLTMYVITRNSHKDEIISFLAAQGVRCAGVIVCRKGTSKAAAMLEVMPTLASTGSGDDIGAARAIFVDDTVRECCDDRVAAIPGLYRVLFRRGAA